MAPESEDRCRAQEKLGWSSRLAIARRAPSTGLRATVGELWALTSRRLAAPAFTGAFPPSSRALASLSKALDSSMAPAPRRTSAAAIRARADRGRRSRGKVSLRRRSAAGTPVSETAPTRRTCGDRAHGRRGEVPGGGSCRCPPALRGRAAPGHDQRYRQEGRFLRTGDQDQAPSAGTGRAVGGRHPRPGHEQSQDPREACEGHLRRQYPEGSRVASTSSTGLASPGRSFRTRCPPG